VVGDVSMDTETLLVNNFINLKIKSVQPFRVVHRSRMCACVYMIECSYVYEYHMYMSIFI
jgi:hypothetical protein